ncbi:conserved Plasmodium protein, unknown function [Plasmodium malariae]|uniref:Uncharacterized protein n=1 Tax=Plasmodium malariae TaxID=5858 RepID=A0A1A8VR56_PLAMA|nr:conserved Plasmodium protein, unknown function [Plasmodium malariae]
MLTFLRDEKIHKEELALCNSAIVQEVHEHGQLKKVRGDEKCKENITEVNRVEVNGVEVNGVEVNGVEVNGVEVNSINGRRNCNIASNCNKICKNRRA